jgi:ATP-dependent protease HslVU (ClpYQ) peptidase subunit
MTCVVGIVEDGNIYIGADSRGSSGHQYVTRKDSKVFISKDFIFGFTSSFRMGQIIKYHFNPPKRVETQSTDNYIHTTVLEHIIEILTSKGYNKISNNIIEGGVFLMGYRGILYEVEQDFQVGQLYSVYNAIGCGENYAKSCLWTIDALGFPLSVTEKIDIAIKCAAEHNSGVDANIKILTLGKGCEEG